MPKNDPTVLVEDAKIIRAFSNFKGEEGQYNRAGARNFCLLLDPDLAAQLERDNWNVKKTKEREVDDEVIGGELYLKVNVGYKVRTPKITMVGVESGSQTEITEDTVDLLDDVDIVKVDVLFGPYNYDKADPKLITPYVRTMIVYIEEDFLMKKLEGMKASAN